MFFYVRVKRTPIYKKNFQAEIENTLFEFEFSRRCASTTQARNEKLERKINKKPKAKNKVLIFVFSTQKYFRIQTLVPHHQ